MHTHVRVHAHTHTHFTVLRTTALLSALGTVLASGQAIAIIIRLHHTFPNHSCFLWQATSRFSCKKITWVFKNIEIQVGWMWWGSLGPVCSGASNDRSGSSWNCLWAALLPPPNTPKSRLSQALPTHWGIRNVSQESSLTHCQSSLTCCQVGQNYTLHKSFLCAEAPTPNCLENLVLETEM